MAVQPANGNRTNVLFAQLKYAVSSLSTSLYSILLILLLSQVLCIAPYTYAEKFYRGRLPLLSERVCNLFITQEASGKAEI